MSWTVVNPEIGCKKVTRSVCRLSLGEHACMFYQTCVEYFRGVVPYIQNGLQRQEMCICLTEHYRPVETLEVMMEEDVDLCYAIKTGQLRLTTKDATFIPERAEGPHRPTLQWLTEEIAWAKQGGFGGLRLLLDMSWLLQGRNRYKSFSAELPVCERAISKLVAQNDVVCLCLYPRNAMTRQMRSEIVDSHKTVINYESDLPISKAAARVKRAF